MEALEGVSVDPSGIGVVGLIVLFGIAMGRGWIVTRREANDIRHDRDEWRAESRIKDVQIAEQADQLRELKPLAQAVHNIMRAIQRGPIDDEVPQ